MSYIVFWTDADERDHIIRDDRGTRMVFETFEQAVVVYEDVVANYERYPDITLCTIGKQSPEEE